MQKQAKIVQIQQKPFSVLLCQLNPFHKNAKNSIDRCERSLKKYSSSNNIDIIMFPQMSFIGYNFKDKSQAIQYGHFPMQGQQFQFIIQQAKRLKSYIGFGYIQKAKKNQNSNINNEEQLVLYNSVAIIDRQGKLHTNYRKSHLYFNDQLWAEQGDGFKVIQLINKKGDKFKCVPAICMDINPKHFTSGEYQLADFIIKNDIQIMLLFTNWVDSQKLDIQSQDVKATYQYWLSRLYPLFNSKKQRLLLFCDRCGYQDDVFAKKKIQFYGSSCGIMVNPTYMIKNLSVKDQGYLLIQTKLPKINQQLIEKEKQQTSNKN